MRGCQFVRTAFILIEIVVVRLVGFFLCITETHPPHFSGTINAFGASIFQSAANSFGLRVIGGDGNDCGASLPERIFIDE
jgi:hypothetical protein